MKFTLRLVVSLFIFHSAAAQSPKSNALEISYRIPKKLDVSPYKTYSAKLVTNVILLSNGEMKDVEWLGSASDKKSMIASRNDTKKMQLAMEYMRIETKGLKQVNVFGDVVIELTTSDFVVNDVMKKLWEAGDKDVIARMDGSAHLEIKDKTKQVLLAKDLVLPESERMITREHLMAMNPGLGVQIKVTSKSDPYLIEKKMTEGLEDSKGYYVRYFLNMAAAEAKALLQDQKGTLALPVYSAKGKNDYSELDQAAESFKGMVKTIQEKSIDALKSESNSVLAKGAEVWEREQAQKSAADDARISEDIGRALNLNLASAYILQGEWDKASEALGRTGFVIAEGTELGGTGSAKEYFIGLQRMFWMARAAEGQVVFGGK